VTLVIKSRAGRLDQRVRKAPSPIHGFGCFARVAFQAGDRIGTFEGDRVQEDGTYVLWVYDAEGQALSAREGRNLLRWLNHSPDPNAELDAFELYARRQIEPGDEITIDYAGTGPSAYPPAPE
jgi:SET domain-containing protein